MSNIFFVPYHNSGGHFLTWSMYYLCGYDEYFSKDEDKYISLPEIDNTITQTRKNFHIFKPTKSRGYNDTLNKIGKAEFIYASVISDELAAKHLNIDLNYQDDNHKKQLEEFNAEDSIKLFNISKDYPLVFIDYCDYDYRNQFYNNRNPLSRSSKSYDSFEDELKEVELFYSSKTGNYFDENIWDRREKLALMLNYLYKKFDYYKHFDKTLPHLYYNTDDIWNGLDSIVYEIAEFFNQKIDYDRFTSWKIIYSRWRENHKQYFSRHLNRITRAIVNNEYLSLKRFEMDFYKECLIQSSLIYDYNLNLKTWGLEKFPENTRDLHSLLEPNIHVI